MQEESDGQVDLTEPRRVCDDAPVIALDQTRTGIRRAEIEGQQGHYVAEPDRLREIADAYARRNPAAPALVEVRIVIRWYGIRDGRPTGTSVDQTVVAWRAP